jgi:hypothetical protein
MKLKASFWLLVVAGNGACLLLVLVWAARTRDDAYDTSHLTAEGKISEIKIVVDHTVDSMYGGRIFYRIEAHVTYEIEGQSQDRWVTASEITSFREMLKAKLARQPQSCQIYWTPGHPENARCRLN